MDPFRKTLQNIQVIMFALVGGLLMVCFLIIYMVFTVKPGGFIAGNGPQWGNLPLMTTMFVGISVITLILSFVVPAFISRLQIKLGGTPSEPFRGELASWETADQAWLERVPAGTLDKLLNVYQSHKILTVALAEAGGILSAIAYLLEGYWVAIAMVAVVIVSMILRIPTKSTMNAWLFEQVERMKREQP